MNELNEYQIELFMKGAGITKSSFQEWMEDSRKSSYSGSQFTSFVSNMESFVKEFKSKVGDKKFYIVKLQDKLDVRLWKV